MSLVVPPWVISVVLLSDPGAASWASGADGEEWTSNALRRALGPEYRILDDVQLTRSNIDHVVIGPAGVFVVETKWSSHPWGTQKGGGAIRKACKQVQVNAGKLEKQLEAKGIALVAQPLVVLWGGRTRAWAVGARVREVDRVTVVAGIGLRQWATTVTGDRSRQHASGSVQLPTTSGTGR